MIRIEQSHNGKIVKLSEKQHYIIVDALLHEIQRHNQAEDLLTDKTAREAVKKAKQQVFKTYQAVCSLLYDPEE